MIGDDRVDLELKQLDRTARGHRTTIRHAWQTPAPDLTLPGRGYDDDRVSGSGTSDPVAAFVTDRARTRKTVAVKVAGVVADLGQTLDSLGVPLGGLADHVSAVVATPADRLAEPSDRDVLWLLDVHTSWYGHLLDLTGRWHSEGMVDDAKIVMVHARRLGSDMRRAAGTARGMLTLPDHEDARSGAVCADPVGRGRHPLTPTDVSEGRSVCARCRRRKVNA